MSFAGEFLGLPGLRGYWPMNAIDDSGNVIDQSGSDRTLAYNGNPTFSFHASGGPYVDLDGTGDYLSRGDEAVLDIVGTEAYVASAVRGLTMGGWFWADSITGTRYLITKGDGASNPGTSWIFYLSTGAPTILFASGSSTVSAAGSAISTGTWYFLAGRFTTSSEAAVFVYTTKTTTATAFSSINNTAANFNIGAVAGTNLLDGRAGMCFLCAMALSDTAINNIYNNTKASYGL